MEKSRVEEIKMELNDCLNSQDYGCLSEESIMEILSLLEGMYPESEVSKDTTPMIGTNPFRKSSNHGSEEVNPTKKDFNQSLNYRVQKFDDFKGNENS